jgi:hypothetical protein
MFGRLSHAGKLLVLLQAAFCAASLDASAAPLAKEFAGTPLLSAPFSHRTASHQYNFFTDEQADVETLERARELMLSVKSASYPELAGTNIEIQLFRSEKDFFRTRFSIARFLDGQKMCFRIEVNPKAFNLHAPEEALHAIMAHELGHVFAFTQGKRIRLLGLVRLASKGFSARFERQTDLQAISRGYAKGLSEYRIWLYRNVPAKYLRAKKRDYFSPEEIAAILSITERRPEALKHWMKHVPRNLKEIQSYDEHTCP